MKHNCAVINAFDTYEECIEYIDNERIEENERKEEKEELPMRIITLSDRDYGVLKLLIILFGCGGTFKALAYRELCTLRDSIIGIRGSIIKVDLHLPDVITIESLLKHVSIYTNGPHPYLDGIADKLHQ